MSLSAVFGLERIVRTEMPVRELGVPSFARAAAAGMGGVDAFLVGRAAAVTTIVEGIAPIGPLRC